MAPSLRSSLLAVMLIGALAVMMFGPWKLAAGLSGSSATVTECVCHCDVPSVPSHTCPSMATVADAPSCPPCVEARTVNVTGEPTLELPTMSVTQSCATAKKALVVHLPSNSVSSLVNLRRMCELSSVVYDSSWKLRVYVNASLSAEQRAVLALRCKLCYEEVLVSHNPNVPLWWAKFHALQDDTLTVGLLRSIHSRPNAREAKAVARWLSLKDASSFHGLRDHPSLHDVPIVPHLWGFQGPISTRNAVFEAAKRLRTLFGEAVFLADWSAVLLPHMRFADSFFSEKFANSEQFVEERWGIDYCGRLGDERDADMQQGYREMMEQSQQHRSHPLPPCLSVYSRGGYVAPPLLEAVDGERRYLSFGMFGARKVDRDEVLKAVELLARGDFYWGWGLLLFVRSDVPETTISDIVSRARPLVPVEVYEVDTTSSQCVFLNKDARIWRYVFPMTMQNVDRFVSRDADSVIWAREWYAVEQWIASGLNVHSMRDHSSGHDFPLMAGMWGAVHGSFPGLFDAAKEAYPAFQQNDQMFLAKYMYPHIQDVVLGHDSQHCLKYHSLPFPGPRWVHFVGQTPSYPNTPAPDQRGCEARAYYAFK